MRKVTSPQPATWMARAKSRNVPRSRLRTAAPARGARRNSDRPQASCMASWPDSTLATMAARSMPRVGPLGSTMVQSSQIITAVT